MDSALVCRKQIHVRNWQSQGGDPVQSNAEPRIHEKRNGSTVKFAITRVAAPESLACAGQTTAVVETLAAVVRMVMVTATTAVIGTATVRVQMESATAKMEKMVAAVQVEAAATVLVKQTTRNLCCRVINCPSSCTLDSSFVIISSDKMLQWVRR